MLKIARRRQREVIGRFTRYYLATVIATQRKQEKEVSRLSRLLVFDAQEESSQRKKIMHRFEKLDE